MFFSQFCRIPFLAAGQSLRDPANVVLAGVLVPRVDHAGASNAANHKLTAHPEWTMQTLYKSGTCRYTNTFKVKKWYTAQL
jgi:hypothetical protein